MTDPQKQQEQELLALRDEIDEIDRQIHELINQRAGCAQRVAQVKEKYQGVNDAVFYRPEREAQVLRKVMERNRGPLEDREVARLFREVMSVCLALEKPLQIAYLGPAGAFTQLASHKHFGNSANTHPKDSLDQVFSAVQHGDVNYGVVPIEHSTQGVAVPTLDLFKRYDLNICGEVELQVQLHLYSPNNRAFCELNTVYASADTLAQCQAWLQQHCPEVAQVVVESQQDALECARKAHSAAVVAGDGALDTSWHLLKQNISSDIEHKARFLIIGRQEVGPSGRDKTSILVAAKNKPGALRQLLAPFHDKDISLTGIETHSAEGILGAQCSVFYIDFEGHKSIPDVAQALEQVREESVELKMLGSYPRAVI
ncbi:MAG: chorismate mutase [Pseudomonadales bacterium]